MKRRHRAVFLATIAAIVLVPAMAVFAQTQPNWNITLPADPGTGSQKVRLESGVLNVSRTFPQNTVRFSVPMKQIATITSPYQYKKNWLIDLHLSKKTTIVNSLDVVHTVDRTPADEVSLMFLSQADAAQAREFLLSHR
jgi:hypothetical protein